MGLEHTTSVLQLLVLKESVDIKFGKAEKNRIV
jgi:hypothetical protein